MDIMVRTLRVFLGDIEGVVHPALEGRDGGFEGDKEEERESLRDLGRVIFMARSIFIPEWHLCLSFIPPR